MDTSLNNEIGLDPDNWNDIRTLGYAMVDDMVTYLEHAGDRPVWSAIPGHIKDTYSQPLPKEGVSPAEVYRQFKDTIFPFATGNTHPRFFSWVHGTGTPLGALADLMAGVMNVNAAIGDHSALYIERQVIDWCKELFNYPQQASGLLVSGASIASITALLVARNAAEDEIKTKGLYATDKILTAYCSTETHNCISKAIEVTGIGGGQLRKIAVDKNYAIDVNTLREQIAADKAKGFLPFCIIGNAGTVNTGAIDDLDALAGLAAEERIWFHIDGAFGALAKLVPSYSKQLEGIERADSLAFDFHKWLYMPYEAGCVLIKDAAQHRKTFAIPANYLMAHERGLAAGPDPLSNYGMELSRGFKALKVWMSFKEHGINKYAALVEQNIQQARYLGNCIKANPKLELLAEVSLNVVCYRYRGLITVEEGLDALNKELLMQMQEKGIAAPSFTLLDGKYVLRVAITNHRTRQSDLDAIVTATVAIGDALAQTYTTAGFPVTFA